MSAAKRPTPLDAALLKRFPLPPIDDGDKNAHGTILIIAGSRDVPGAPLLCALAAMRAGAGKLQIATVASAAPQLGMAMPEAMVLGLSEDRSGGFASAAVKVLADRAKDADAIVAGPGLASNSQCASIAAALFKTGVPLALDAALLRALPARKKAAERADTPPILLPHAGEMATLLECSEEEVESDLLAAGRCCADRYDSLTLVKGVQSHVVGPDGTAFLYAGGAPGLGVSGSGDTLAGIVGGLLARGAAPLTALLWAVWLHGEAGAALARRIGPAGFLAREIPGEIPALLPR